MKECVFIVFYVENRYRKEMRPVGFQNGDLCFLTEDGGVVDCSMLRGRLLNKKWNFMRCGSADADDF